MQILCRFSIYVYYIIYNQDVKIVMKLGKKYS